MPEHRPIMGIDPSLTGFAVVMISGSDSIVRREIKTEAKNWPKTMVGRLARYEYLIKEAVSLAREVAPELILIEGYSYGSKGRAIISLGELGAILRKEIIGYADFACEVPPKTLKKFATGNGNASKLKMVQSLLKRYGFESETDNEGDAFALAKLGCTIAGHEKVETKFQQEVVDLIKEVIQREITK